MSDVQARRATQEILTTHPEALMRIAVIEDDVSLNELMARRLRAAGFRITQGYTGEEAIAAARGGETELLLLDFSLPDMRASDVLHALDDGGPRIPFIVITGNGDEMIAVEMMKHGARDYLVKNNSFLDSLTGAVVDVCNALRHEAELAEMEARLREQTLHREQAETESMLLKTAIEQSAEAMLITDADGAIQYINPAFLAVTGYSREEVIGQNPRMLKSGAQDEQFYRGMWETLLQGRTWKGTLENRRKDGTHYVEEATISPVRDTDGKTTHYVAVKRDVTTELALERQLRHSQKMQAIGTLAGGIAHDFNNLLTSILGYSEIVRDDMPDDHPSRDDLAHVIKAANRARDLVRQILAFSRHGDETRRAVRPDFVINESLRILIAALPATVVIDSRIDKDCGHILADPTQLQQVLLNLCNNACQAMPDRKGTIVVELRAAEIDEEAKTAWPELRPGRYAMLSVEDNGCGMSRETIARIFDPFFTTKPAGEGTGLGLASVQGIVTAHGGAIRVYSELGKGTRFHVYFPCTESTAETTPSARAIPSGKERILVIDDDEDITQILARSLERLGYSVVRCTAPEDAMLVLRKHPELFDVVLSDQTMPGTTGLEIAEEVHGIRPELPVILCSGLVNGVAKQKMEAAHVAAFLSKPIEVSTLAVTVREVLDRHSGRQAG